MARFKEIKPLKSKIYIKYSEYDPNNHANTRNYSPAKNYVSWFLKITTS